MTRVLVVDDHDDMRVLLRLRLAALPDVAEVSDAPDGRAAIAAATAATPDVVVLDLQMPVMSGDVALPVLRGLLPDAYIVVNSAKPRSLVPRAVLELADAYCEKLVDDVVETIARRIRALTRPAAGQPAV